MLWSKGIAEENKTIPNHQLAFRKSQQFSAELNFAALQDQIEKGTMKMLENHENPLLKEITNPTRKRKTDTHSGTVGKNTN